MIVLYSIHIQNVLRLENERPMKIKTSIKISITSGIHIFHAVSMLSVNWSNPTVYSTVSVTLGFQCQGQNFPGIVSSMLWCMTAMIQGIFWVFILWHRTVEFCLQLLCLHGGPIAGSNPGSGSDPSSGDALTCVYTVITFTEQTPQLGQIGSELGVYITKFCALATV